MPSTSPARNTSEHIFSAPKHTPTDDKIINNTKMPTARTALEGKAMKTIAEIYFLYPDDPDIPLVQFNAPNDIKKLNNDELINITTDRNALFSWSYNQLTAQDGWLINTPSTPNIDDDDNQNLPQEVKHDDDEPTTDKNVENCQLDIDDQQPPTQNAQNDEDDSLTNVNHDEDCRYDGDTQKHTDDENHIDGILKNVKDFKSTEEPQGVDEIKF